MPECVDGGCTWILAKSKSNVTKTRPSARALRAMAASSAPQVLLSHGVRTEACAAQQNCTLRRQVLVDFEIQAIRSSGSATVPSRANSAA